MMPVIAKLYHRVLSEDVLVPTLKATLLDAAKSKTKKRIVIKPTRSEMRAEAAWKRYCEENNLNDAGVKKAA